MTQKPDEVLYEESKALPIIASCDHYAGKEAFIIKAFEIQNSIGPFFDVTCDLEDGAANGNEAEHLRKVSEILNSNLNQFHMAGVRIHPVTSPFWEEEISHIIRNSGTRISHITLPKVCSADEVFLVSETIQSLCNEIGIEKEIGLHVLIESQDALQEVFEIATIPGLRGLDFGIMDFISSHDGVIPIECLRSPGQFEHALLKRAKAAIVAAATLNGLIASHNVNIAYEDTEGTKLDALRARKEFGFLRMWSINPSQIRPIIEAMSPSFEDIEKACKILLLAQRENWGPISFGSELYDKASYRYYWQLLKRAKCSGLPLPDESLTLF
ncbi:MAG: CoA ester lyase [SAR324 cluster bacterium]|uniref:CoA ester lyase n=1 Tax=SAR324 cluster bacterium TaxID=2024889 RepID=A0A7X9FTW5_9DELT|nr:CoA ester lyase [SAR324 cluster bacterium]